MHLCKSNFHTAKHGRNDIKVQEYLHVKITCESMLQTDMHSAVLSVVFDKHNLGKLYKHHSGASVSDFG